MAPLRSPADVEDRAYLQRRANAATRGDARLGLAVDWQELVAEINAPVRREARCWLLVADAVGNVIWLVNAKH